MSRRGVEKVRDTKWASCEKPYTQYEVVPRSMLASSEAYLLYDVTERLGSGSYANLGVGRGGSTFCLAEGLRYNNHTGIVHGVDTFSDKGVGWPKQTLEDLQTIVEESGLEDYITFHKGFTSERVEDFKGEVLNFVFIDADHSYEGCKKDFRLWSPLVKVGGEIAFHDVHLDSVDKVIDELDSRVWQQVDHVYITKLFKRIK